MSEEPEETQAEDQLIRLEKALSKPFPKSVVQWRAKMLTRDKKKALALAYIDSRAVMDRLDEAIGIGGWQCEYKEISSGRMACGIGILFGEEWVWKWDGAGGTEVEMDKGIFSAAFKRAAVKWGIGRYLYELGATWVPCTTYTGGDGKQHFKDFTDNPWDYTHYRTDEKRAKKEGGLAPTSYDNPKEELLHLLKCPALSAEVVAEITAAIEKKQVRSWYERQVKIVKGLIADCEKEAA